MPLYRPSELLEFLRSLKALPKKSLSQNFLIDGNILKKIAALAELQADDVIVEIGPGPGALTEHLLEIGCHVIAIEKDNVFAESLKRLKTATNKFEVYCDDALNFSLVEHLKKVLQNGKKAKVVANIPYSITTPLIEKIAEASSVISSATLMVQDEVAKRFVAKEKSSDYGYFSAFLKLASDVKYGFLVPSNCFYPAPKVHSAVIYLDFEKKTLPQDEKQFLKMLKAAFMKRRKMLKASLKDLYPPQQIEAALQEMGKELTARPEELTASEWLKLFKLIQV
jgi:16S rRNA (adenine1518-N6/adenine1519-N6)-dimethyltransferase